MLYAIQTALSGLAAFTKQVEVTGYNVANVNSEEFKKSNTELSQWRPGECAPSFGKTSPPVLQS